MGSTAEEDRAARIASGKDELEKWNWGAFLWGPIWAFGHKIWKQAWIGLAISVVTLGIASIGVSVWYALKGNGWIWERGGYGSKEELRQKERKWAWAALIGVLVWIAFWILLALVGSN